MTVLDVDARLITARQQRKHSRQSLIAVTAALAVAFLLLAAMGSQWFATLAAGIVLLTGVNLLWRPGETPILIFIFVYQWLQASLKIFQVAAAGVSWRFFSGRQGDVELASLLSLVALLALGIGLRAGAGAQRTESAQHALAVANSVSLSIWFKWYLLAFLVARIALLVAGFIPGLSQPLLALASLKWTFFFMLTYASFAGASQQKTYWFIAFMLEMMLGLFSFFSDFKVVLLFSLFGIVAAGIKISFGKMILVALLVAFTLFVAVVWTGVKTEYRDFLNAGSQTQAVATDYLASLSKLGTLTNELNGYRMELAFREFIDRLSYVQLFGQVLEVVPNMVPHTNGEIWGDAIARPFMPRLLFPNKSIINDSARTIMYAKTTIIGADRGTSVSIGYIGESYIDFGPYLMVLPILAYGWLLGRIYRWLVVNEVTKGLLGMGLATAILMVGMAIETSITKSFGGLMVSLLVTWVLIRYVFPVFLRRCLSMPIRKHAMRTIQ